MSNGDSVYHRCQHETRPAKETLLTLPPPHRAPCLPPTENINVRGGLWLSHLKCFWHLPSRDTTGGEKLLLTHPSKESGVAPKPPDPSCTVARLDVSPFTTSCLRLQPRHKLQHCLFTYTNANTVNTEAAQLSFSFTSFSNITGEQLHRQDTERKGKAGIGGPVQFTHCISSLRACVTVRCQTGVNRAALISTNMQKDLVHMTCHMKK